MTPWGPPHEGDPGQVKPSPNLKDVGRALLKQDRAKWEHILKDNLPPTERYAVLINGKNIQSLEGLETKIREGDEIVFAVLISGG